ncbi:MAG TPA: hypothetical protein VJB90_02440 [Candidatus Nanoarchaeia archaeon]|nr:hypothetical protein [Candidatus Nanoarchaeia archaeon]
MADISNKTLALLMVAAIVVSLGGLFISLDRLGSFQNSITGFAASNVTGRANVTIENVAGITISDNIINFGTCNLPTSGTVNVSSNESNTGGTCTDGTGDVDWFPDNLSIRNDGNTNLNITIRTDSNVSKFLGTSGNKIPAYRYVTYNVTEDPRFFGCMPNKYMCPAGNESCCNVTRRLDEAVITNNTANCSYTADWTNFTFNEVEAPTNEMKACSNLTYANNKRNITLFLQIQIPDDLQSAAPSGKNSTAILNFTARALT